MDRDNGALVVADVAADGKIVVRTDNFNDSWPDETKVDGIEIQKIPDGWFLVLNGTRKDGVPISQYVPVDFTKDGSLSLRLESNGLAVSDTCTGNPCTRCAFLHGACSCTGTGTVCNHSHTQLVPEEMLPLKIMSPFE